MKTLSLLKASTIRGTIQNRRLIAEFLPRNPNEGYTFDPNRNTLTEMSVLEAEQRSNNS